MHYYTYKKLVGVYKPIIFMCYFTIVQQNKKKKEKR